MKTIMVRYKTLEAQADTNAALVRAVFEELGACAPKGLRYASYRLPDGVTFVHIATLETPDENPLVALPSFKAFQNDHKAAGRYGAVSRGLLWLASLAPDMKAMAAASYGPLERIAQIDAALPTPGRDEVRVRVVASALNPADYKVLLGALKFLHARNRPLIVCYDFSGTVDAIGPSVAGVSVGDDVFGFLPYGPGNTRGAFAESLIARCDEIALNLRQYLTRTLRRRPPPGSRQFKPSATSGGSARAAGTCS
jgi:hypothetical protein